jgi:type II secretory pathway pseudopilin PulG
MTTARGRASTHPGSAGFTYLGVLCGVVIMGIALASIGTVWTTHARREKEADLLFAGGQFRSAIMRYQLANPKVGDGYPKTLEMLLEDPNAPNVRRFLRRIYVDPMTGKAEWGLLRSPSGGIIGVYSLSQATPIKTANFPDYLTSSEAAKTYADWKFVVPSVASTAQAPAGAVPASPAVLNDAAVAAQTAAPQPVATEGPVAPTSPFKDRRCPMLAASDQQVCSTLERQHGQRASLPCFTSAQERQAACEAGGPIQPLAANVR